MFNLSGKKALVTGASGGIGAAIAQALAKQGAEIGLAGRNEAKLAETASGISGSTHLLLGDLGENGGAAALYAKAESAMGGVDILVCNAGLTRDGLAMRMKEDDWNEVLKVNLTANFQLMQACLKGMMKARWGRMINITSVVGVSGNPGQCNYAASKAGLIGLSKSLAQEVASRGITVNCIAPGFIKTAMTDALNDAQKDAITRNIPSGTFGLPEDIAAAASYLASEEARYVTGQTLHVNGGMLMI